MDSGNIATEFERTAKLCPEKLAVVEGDAAWTFARLAAETARIAAGLRATGITPGMRTVLMVPPSRDFFALTFALFQAGAVPVLVDPGMGIAALGKCLAEARAEAFIGVSKAHAARVVLRWGGGNWKQLVTVGRRWFWGGVTLDSVRSRGDAAGPLIPQELRASDLAAVLFTSGSTGIPKGAMYTHGMFHSQVVALRAYFGMGPEDIDLPTFPLFALFDACLGVTAIIPRMDFTRPGEVNPVNIIEPIRKHGVTQMFGSPALLDRVGRYGADHQVRLPTLKRVISAGAPVPASVLDRFKRMLSAEADIHTPYGATEALPVACISAREVLSETRARSAKGAGTCVGRRFTETEVVVVKITDEPFEQFELALLMPPGQVGEFAVRGPVVSAGYFGRPEADRLAKIKCADGTFYHRMGDLGYVDEDGRLWFCGRKSHRVITPAGTLYTIPCEAIFNEHPAVRRTALVGVGEPGCARPILCVEREADATTSEMRLREELLALGQAHEHTRGIREILFHPRFPVDIRHNAKIFREKLAIWAGERVSA